MRRHRLLIPGLFVVLCGPMPTLRAQFLGGEAHTPTQRRTISGVVVNNETGQPIPRALVQAGSHAMLTDGEGRFEFPEMIDPGYLNVTKPGYFQKLGWNAFAAGPQQSEIRLLPEALITGRVTDAASGEPVDGLMVGLRTLVVVNGVRRWEQRASVRTNAEGEYRIAELQAGEYALQTELKPDRSPEGDAAAGYAPAEYPVVGENGREALRVHPGDKLQADISTHLERFYPVSGAVEGLPANGAFSLTVSMPNGVSINAPWVPRMMRNLERDQLRLMLPSGSFVLNAQAFVPTGSGGFGVNFGAGEQRMARKKITIVDGPVSGLKLVLESTATVPVEVSEEKPTSPQGGDQPHGAPHVMLWSADADAGSMAFGAESAEAINHPGESSGAPQASGPLFIRNVQPGQYFLQVSGNPGWYAASAVCGGTDLTRETLVVTGGSVGCSVRVVMRNDAASLKVLPSSPAKERLLVYLVPLNNLTRDIQLTFTRPDGAASFDSLAPGQYLALETPHEVQLAWRDPESLRRYTTEGKRIDLAAGAKEEVQVPVFEGEP